MSNKQIIIDGVDVSECIECDIDKIKDGYDALCCLTNCSCKYHPNCHYKQLKRKEQECEKLKENLPNAITRLMGENDQLKAENEKLKEEKQGLIKDWEEKKNLGYEIACKNEKLKEEIDQLKGELQKEKDWHKTADEITKKNSEYVIQLKAENEELKEQLELNTANAVVIDMTQRLFQLKQTLTEIKEIAENAYCLTNATNKDMAQFAKQVLQKISEVE